MPSIAPLQSSVQLRTAPKELYSMKLSKCANGHFYDSDKYPECPYCNTDLLKDHAIVHEGEAEPPAAVAQAEIGRAHV